MVASKSISAAKIRTNVHEMILDSGKRIKYVAPRNIAMSKDALTIMRPVERSLLGDHTTDDWEGVQDFCQAMDDMIEVEMDRELFLGKKVLEIGFCTGLPSAFALQRGAKEVEIYCDSQAALECYIKPTLRRNNVRPEKYKIVSALHLSSIDASLNGYDVILAPEIIRNTEENLEVFHSIFERVLKDGGIILLMGRTYYNDYDGNIPSFMDFVKSKGQFDAIIRWTSQNQKKEQQEVAPRKMIQITRCIR
uniref:Uncharacterized protein n=1 Tax=Acrobeloides nanus TaxID=290746 RepID=A0A914D2C1_9BILA